jgi:hypothetical protein
MTAVALLGDKPVNRIGFGAMQLAGPGVFGPPRDPGRLAPSCVELSNSRLTGHPSITGIR